MGITDFFMKMNLATGGQDPNAALIAALNNLGLHKVHEKGAISEYQGVYQGWNAAYRMDGSAIMQAGRNAYAQAIGLEVGNAVGLVSNAWADWQRDMNDLHARSNMREARVSIYFAIDGGRAPAAPVTMGRDPSAGHPLAQGIFCNTTQEAWPHLQQPFVTDALAGARFDRLGTKGQFLSSIWMPPMKDYQHIAASPAAFGDMVNRNLWALASMAAVLFPR